MTFVLYTLLSFFSPSTADGGLILLPGEVNEMTITTTSGETTQDDLNLILLPGEVNE